MEKKEKGSHGGKRPGAGRPKGSKDTLTVNGLLEAIQTKAKGKNYEQILVEDFLEARTEGDRQLILKYHNLILSKVMNTLARVEVAEDESVVESKQAAFAEALARLAGVDLDKDK